MARGLRQNSLRTFDLYHHYMLLSNGINVIILFVGEMLPLPENEDNNGKRNLRNKNYIEASMKRTSGLNGYVNKQNCRIWSETNPQVYVETPLHPEKLTVWCALWAGGILLQKR
ncbi:hypothetical protein TNCV_1732001 [Trichonephila clavipes]|nr:hypothetical protein TNCV_1732001 [Trichonephila clavipes]